MSDTFVVVLTQTSLSENTNMFLKVTIRKKVHILTSKNVYKCVIVLEH